MLTIDSFALELSAYLGENQIQQVQKAYYFAEAAHKGQARRSGEAYISHPLAVAAILADMHMDHQCLMAALLHDVIEDTGIPKHTISKEFDEEVADLVDGVSKLKMMFQTRAEAQAENFQKMTLAMAKDIRVIMVKLADRLHNMRTIGHLSGEKQRRIARETLEIYAPIANRLGMNTIRVEFEELGFKALYPLRSSMIEKAVRKARGNRKEYVNNILETITNCLTRDGIDGEVFGREKHLYSIYDKMRSKRRSFAEIMDVYAFRIVVDTVDTCYRVLGSVHNLYKPVAGRFKDYIAIPKANGYQSLHTTLFGMHGLPIEIQIRTFEMEMVANNGIAGHWLYKANDESNSGSHKRAREWMKGLLEIQQSAGNSLEFIENVKIDLFPDEVYVFTPRGEIYDLPLGATPVDFAYAVHTDIGNTCVACRIDRRLAPLSATLESGQTVEIITAPGAHPNPAWLSFVITGKARGTIRHTLKNQQRNESLALGRRLLERTLKTHQTSIDAIQPERLQEVLSERNMTNLDQLLEAIGLGNQMAAVIARRLAITVGEAAKEPAIRHSPLAIMGTEGLVVTYAKCCKPIPGDPIIGHISAGKGIVIHMDTCRNMAELRAKPEESMSVRWDPRVTQEFSVELRVELEHEKNIVAVLASTIANADANVERISMMERDAHLSSVNLVLAVRDRIHLANVIKRLRIIKGVIKITRMRS
ncbi:MAG: bifunctional GTP diphosphokinase/guanosine-3',5'-bis pyrophosphate 3'-pyrophosphohydrolase [Pseudomonadales bacterium]|nr:bifunctional GTP diphosphokinase/guanosine-3',5'-bis pyrophosphate 3'-pyrophosphohydrolase [Pseudomonadales bacterium]MDP4640980.1 bifunctional GTP diphosphokinase/guanosine-3',5'-bis pyrophosphate 3'-pyrophosphohydrolase [Pseudomonadales bacterium]MDP4766189.1 bifunctional GTP diphosphokinase/guanosine-3',5'-bis pyrophosphate 3'-pyrophosphohydrolase [Pseudomonadales bacterium]MDP4874595.1 bifunctional GTP diphosphokinase/guanosine-3',5'-bis pyrophosphate 3'-pyrophosphohydrolase [Pseudomonada